MKSGTHQTDPNYNSSMQALKSGKVILNRIKLKALESQSV